MSTGFNNFWFLRGKMDLKKYLKSKGISIAFFARELGVSQQTLHGIYRGHEISLSTAIKIEELTEGKVACKDLIKKIKKSPIKPEKDI
jgi:transcriptional regulator with XRE-family HTH domain